MPQAVDAWRRAWPAGPCLPLSLCLWLCSACSAADIGLAGRYRAVQGQNAEMVVQAQGGRWRVVLKGGGGLAGAAARAGDCEAVAEGALVAQTLQARLVPFDGEATSLDAVDIARIDPVVTVRFSGSQAVVEGKFSHCGLRNVLAGTYQRLAP